MGRIRRLVLDTLKPHAPSSIVLADKLSDLDGVNSVNVSISEFDLKVEKAKITIEGDNIVYEAVEGVIQQLGASIHSVDDLAVISGCPWMTFLSGSVV